MGNKKKAIETLKLINGFLPKGVSINDQIETLEAMSEKEFEALMEKAAEGKWTPRVMFPAFGEDDLDMDIMLDFAKKHKIAVLEHLIIEDHKTGELYKTPHEYLVLPSLVRRMEQHLSHKKSLPDNTKIIDHLSGQTTGDSKGASMSQPEALILDSKGLNNTLFEILKVRGGDATAYRAMMSMVTDTGGYSLAPILDLNSTPQVIETLSAILNGMHLSNNAAMDVKLS